MNPKMTFEDAALYLGHSQAWIYAELQELGLAFSTVDNQFYFAHNTAARLFNLPFRSQIVGFQILKGGTGKTSLALEVAIRASLYGARVLCIDLDQQANLTQAFNQNADDVPVMVDILAEGYPIAGSLMKVKEGIDLLPSRIENAMLDEVIRLQELSLDIVYREPFNFLKEYYDLIIVDCPPSLGQSVTACALAVDTLLMPVTPEKFARSGLQATHQFIEELALAYQCHIPLKIVLNKFDSNSPYSEEALSWLQSHPQFRDNLLRTPVRLSQAFPAASLQMGSIFDTVTSNSAKEDIDALARLLLNLSQPLESNKCPTEQEAIQEEYVS
jgi:chromosome partitioning protein